MVRVIMVKNGQEEEFGCFENMSWATYHVALAKSTSGQDGYVNFEDVEFRYEEVE